MLKTINIENIAVIEKTSVDFSSGLNVLTGETGAGKSIIVDSINAILGERTSKELVRYGAESAFVSAYFEDISSAVCDKLEELGIACEEDNSLLLTRKISGGAGKSVCKINGMQATVSMLREIGSTLVNIHGQHDSQALLNPDLQYRYIDMLLEDKTVLDKYKADFKELIAVRRRLKALTSDETDKERQLELLDYQINELESADIKPSEREELTKRKALIQKSEALTKALNYALLSLSGDDELSGAHTLIDASLKQLSKFEEAKEVTDTFARLSDLAELAKDNIDNLINLIDFKPDELENIEERLDVLFRLSEKYGSTEEEMLAFLDEAREKRRLIMFSDEELERVSRAYDDALEKALSSADALSEARKAAARSFEAKVKGELEFLDMPKISFVVSFDKNKLTSNGYDVITFLISTNAGEPPKSLAKIASGGELSRIMLAIKNIIAYNDTIDTLIFDEIDTGVSGRASQKIGLKLKSVAENTQVICVTHSAQLASNADRHFLIQKEFENNRTYTKVAPLNFEERKRELARIMGGLEITDSLLNSAEELLLLNNGN